MIKYTDELIIALQEAGRLAAKAGARNIESQHLLYGLAISGGTAGSILGENELTGNMIRMDVLRFQEESPVYTEREESFRADVRALDRNGGEPSPLVQKILDNAKALCTECQENEVGTEHVLIALLREHPDEVFRILVHHRVDVKKIYYQANFVTGRRDQSVLREEYMRLRAKGVSKGKNKKETGMLEQFCQDLVKQAKAQKLDPVLMREQEMENVMEVLCRRTKNNPCIVGEPGVGKTAIVEGLAQRIAEGKAPESLRTKRLMSLDMTGLVAGTKYRGDFEQRIKDLIGEAVQAGDVILFIDELHTVIGAGGSEGALDASNILKPSLSRGELQIIGATTLGEYRKRVEKDAALERRFQKIVLEEPTVAQTLQILKGLKPQYQEFHQLKITDDALEAAARLSDRYIQDRFLPDKAIDLLDEAAAHKRIQGEGDHTDVQEQDRYEMDIIKALEEGNMEMASSLLAKKKEWKERNRTIEITPLDVCDIEEMVHRVTKIPVSRLQKDDIQSLKDLESTLHERIIGQENAVSSVARAIRRGRVGLKDPNRPIGSFLFLGPTGVGKTELSKALAEVVFGSEKDMIRVDMSEYMEKQSVAKMIGAAPGYVGYEEGGQLSEKVRNHPYSLILFDEIEKAHPDVFHILLQIMEDGRLTDSQGRTVSFKNTILIMTSNVGAQRIVAPKNFGFIKDQDVEHDYQVMKDHVMEEVKNTFRPEFINRIDEIMVFHMLEKEEIAQIAGLLLKEFADRCQEQMAVRLSWQEEVVAKITETGFDKDFGARPLRRKIQNEIEDLLAEKIVEGQVQMGDSVEVWIEGEGAEIQIRKTS